ncbi:unnamed protein product [Effrenium voratum]|uniref:C3H1-type domain-containing protein n=1 Tax=Effrenium voratum TaxID=2562239 RepID=A0AA36HRH4_9DINO|nr:unnamed protein product [Effrenium voratum]CAJ1454466.1 unnamed protein product [Effrenium voratum]
MCVVCSRKGGPSAMMTCQMCPPDACCAVEVHEDLHNDHANSAELCQSLGFKSQLVLCPVNHLKNATRSKAQTLLKSKELFVRKDKDSDVDGQDEADPASAAAIAHPHSTQTAQAPRRPRANPLSQANIGRFGGGRNNNGTERCEFFRQGWCWKGEGCTFRHR